MNPKIKSTLIWFFAVVFTLFIASYQRMTGPTYPVRGKTEIGGQKIKFSLIRSYDLSDDAKVTVFVADTSIKGELRFRRFKSYDNWQIRPMERHGDTLMGALPHQAAAGKVMYDVTLVRADKRFLLNDHPAVLRYTGFVPRYILFPHILLMFLAMLFSSLTGLMAAFRGKNTYVYTWITVGCFFFGGMILGPIVQKFAFDAYWTGWPFGGDLTDNKTFVAFLFWAIALFVIRKNRENRLWPVLASVILLAVYLIPHSVLGSELDYTKDQKIETTK